MDDFELEGRERCDRRTNEYSLHVQMYLHCSMIPLYIVCNLEE